MLEHLWKNNIQFFTQKKTRKFYQINKIEFNKENPLLHFVIR